MGSRGWGLRSTVKDQLAVTVQSSTHWLLYGLGALLTVYYVTTPLGTDVQINVAFAQQARLTGSFPGTLVETWTLRGIGYKLVVYALYVATDSLVDYYDKRLFELVYRSGILLLYLGVVGLGGAVARSRLRRDGYDAGSVVFLVLVSFLSLSHYTAFQPGDIAALLTLLGVALAIADLPWTTPIAGVVFALLATLKGITILYIPLGYLLVVGYDEGYRRSHARLVASTVLAGVLIGGFLYAYAPRTIFDLLAGTQFQSTFEQSLPERLSTVVTPGPFLHIPVLAPAGFAGLALVLSALRSRNYRLAALVLALGVFPLLYVLIQGQGFEYHFTVFLPSAVAIIFLVGRVDGRSGRLYSGLVLAVLLVAVVTVSPVGLAPAAAADEYQSSVRSQATVYGEVRSQTGLSESDTVLYLADGTATYYLGAESHLRYYYPLPLQRVAANERVRETELYARTNARALSYDGEYVVQTAWFDLGPHPALSEKLRTEYCVTYRGSPGARFERDVVVYERRPGDCAAATASRRSETP